ncbi:hypothetical protein HPB48_000880 [Haemaphysalis longicornis]|uniref:CCHC-type domain-containing protein n=1 Tax=Haemaphysalis longicornis TaxID=44386 RepID=A0A9J6GN29_HAELO|nr:hypothetical protein HPB48_000880 [Haemaphysalis longicornis]
MESARPAGTSTGNDYEYLVQGLAAHFDVSTSQRADRIQFRSLYQAETESAIDFARRVQYVGRQCNFGSDEAASLVDQLIVGLASDRTRERLLTEGPALTFDKAIQVIQNVTEVQDLLQRYRAAREEIVQAIDGTQRTRSLRFQQRPTRFPRREFRPTISTNRSATPARPGLRLARTSARRSPACGRCGRMWYPLQQCPALGKTCFQCGKIGHFRNACRTPRPLQQCPALGKTCFQCGKIGHFRNACRTPRSATMHPSSPRVKRHTRSPLRNIEAPRDDEQDVVVVNQLGLHATPTSQESYSDVKVNDSLLSLFVSELAQSRNRESQLAQEMRQLKSQLADLREQLRANSSELEESTNESQEVQVPELQKEDADKPEEDSKKADEANKPEGEAKKANEEDKPKIEDVEYDDESADKKKRRKRGKETVQCVKWR